MDNLETQIDSYKEELDDIVSKETKLKELISKRDSPILKTTKISRVCDKCGQDLNKEDYKRKKRELKNQKKQINDEINDLEKSLSKLKSSKELRTKISNIEDELWDLEEDLSRNKRIEKDIESTEKLNKRREAHIEKIKSEKPPKNKIKSLKSELKSLKSKKVDLRKELGEYDIELDTLNWCIKEALSNKGIKAYIFDSQLSKVNERLNQLADILPFRVEFGVDTDTKSKKFYTLVEHSGGVVNYTDLSGGEQQLVNIAIAFSIHDVVSSDVNALFMDEVFESLDEDNIEIVGDMILQKAERKEVLLVTHTSFYPTGSKVIRFEKNEKGITKFS